MQNKNSIFIILALIFLVAGAILVVIFVLTPTQSQVVAQPTVDVNVVSTSVVGTLIASLSQTQSAMDSLVTNTPQPTITLPSVQLNSPVPPPATFTQIFVLPPAPTAYRSPTATGTQFTPTTNPSNLAVGCNNLRLIRDETIPAGTVFKPGESFTKTWKVENNGTCDWVYLYQLIFASGERMDGDPPALGKVIVPGKWTQLSVALVAPSKPGSYTGSWRFATQSGSPFGATLTVSIVVAKPTDTPAPATATNTSASPTNTNTPVTPSPTDTPVTYP